MEEMLLTDAVDRIIRETRTFLSRAGSQFNRGLLSCDQVYRIFRDAIWTRLPDICRDRCGLRVVRSGPAWLRLRDEWNLWREGRPPESSLGEAWLFCGGSREAWECSPEEREASPEEKAAFFQLMEAFRIPVDCFCPPPEEITEPGLHVVHTYADAAACRISFLCVDDGGLAQDPAPAGKTFVLTDRRGLRARVTIRDALPPEKRENAIDLDDCLPLAAYHGTGQIEGFTACRDRPMTLRSDGSGAVCFLGTRLEEEDWRVYRAYPLWQAYFRWLAGRDQLYRQGCTGLIRLFCPGYADPEDSGGEEADP